MLLKIFSPKKFAKIGKSETSEANFRPSVNADPIVQIVGTKVGT
jgi:hypothetical protein